MSNRDEPVFRQNDDIIRVTAIVPHPTIIESLSLMNVLMCADLTSIWECILSASYDCLFLENTSRRVSSFLAMRPTLMESTLDRLKDQEQQDAVFECEKAAMRNLDTFIRWCKKNPSAELVKKSRRNTADHPKSIAAHTFELRMLFEKGRLAEAHSTLQLIVELGEDEVNKICCKAEIARAYHYLGQQFYYEAIDYYEQVCKSFGGMTKAHIDVLSVIDGCHFRLAQTYSRVMNQGSPSLQHQKRVGFEEAYEKMYENLTTVIRESKNDVNRARAMIELIESYERCSQTGARLVSPDSVASFHDALKLAPEDPYVLEHCGRYYKRIAKDDTDLMEAAKLLERCTDLCDVKHVAWHQQGLIYISLWNSVKRDLKSLADSYLSKAEMCMEQACEKTGRQRGLYLLELAKIYIKQGKMDKAKETFLEADVLSGKADVVDYSCMAQVYSAWADCLNKQRLQGCRGEITEEYVQEEIVVFCLNAIRTSILGGVKIEHGVYKLLLDPTLCKEWDFRSITRRLLYDAINKYGQYDDQPLVELIRRDWPDVFYRLGSFCHEVRPMRIGAEAALMYLTALMKSGEMDVNDREFCRMSLDIAMQVRAEDSRPEAFNYALRDVFRWFIRDAPVDAEDPGSKSEHILKGESVVGAVDWDAEGKRSLEDDFDTFVVTSSDDDAESTKFVMKVLQTHMGLFVGRLSPTVLDLNMANVDEMFAKVTSAVVVADGSFSAWRHANFVLDRLHEKPIPAVCVTCDDAAVDSETFKGKYGDIWQRVALKKRMWYDVDKAAFSIVSAIAESRDICVERKKPTSSA
jgi:tetratricopeptide (TPR) repeat protein